MKFGNIEVFLKAKIDFIGLTLKLEKKIHQRKMDSFIGWALFCFSIFISFCFVLKSRKMQTLKRYHTSTFTF